jgi:hypothetical protein|tara:strand:+ start:40 stop:312 length:273 start_codon:yes stop_codon:yes gene_type:complete
MVKAARDAIHRGHASYKNMKCNHPVRSVHGNKKFKVMACEGGKRRLVRFGDAHMRIKKNIPARRKSFRARHHCNEHKSKLTAGYWSCKKW